MKKILILSLITFINVNNYCGVLDDIASVIGQKGWDNVGISKAIQDRITQDQQQIDIFTKLKEQGPKEAEKLEVQAQKIFAQKPGYEKTKEELAMQMLIEAGIDQLGQLSDVKKSAANIKNLDGLIKTLGLEKKVHEKLLDKINSLDADKDKKLIAKLVDKFKSINEINEKIAKQLTEGKLSGKLTSYFSKGQRGVKKADILDDLGFSLTDIKTELLTSNVEPAK